MFTPVFQQRLAAARVALAGIGQCGDAVGAEVAQVLSQFAKSHHHLHTIEEAQREWPDATLAGLAAGVALSNVKFVFLADGQAQGRHVDVARRRGAAGAYQQR